MLYFVNKINSKKRISTTSPLQKAVNFTPDALNSVIHFGAWGHSERMSITVFLKAGILELNNIYCLDSIIKYIYLSMLTKLQLVEKYVYSG